MGREGKSSLNSKAERHLLNLMALAVLTFIICYGLSSLQEILVPFTLALFLCQLFEWPAQILVMPRNWFMERYKGWRCWRTGFGRAIERALIVFWDLFVILLCIALLGGLVFSIGYGLSNLFDKSRFAKYYESPRVQELIKFLRAHGVEIKPEDIIRRIEDPLANFVQGLVHFLETGFLTLMMLGFLLLGQLTQMHPKIPHLPGLIDELVVAPDLESISIHGQVSRQSSLAGTPRSNSGGRSASNYKVPLMRDMSTQPSPAVSPVTGTGSSGAGGSSSMSQSQGQPSAQDSGLNAKVALGDGYLEMHNVVGAPVPRARIHQDGSHEAANTGARAVAPRDSYPVGFGSSPALMSETQHPSSRFLQESAELTRHAKSTVQWYIILKTFMSALLSILIGGVLYVVDVDFWFVFTVLAFLLNYIPTVGGAISIIAPLFITFLDPTKNITDIILVLALPGAAHILCGNVIEPHLFGSAFDLHPIIVMFCLVVWSSLWGVTGAVLSVPLTCCMKLALKPNISRHPYAMFIYHIMEFRLPDAETLEVFYENDLNSPGDNYNPSNRGEMLPV